MSPKLELPSAPTWRPSFGRRFRAGPEDPDEAAAETDAPDAAAMDAAAPSEGRSMRKPPTAAALLLLIAVFVAALVIRSRLQD
jgi:hypothetical protein